MTNDIANLNSGEDSNSYAKNIVIAAGLAIVYFATHGRLPEGIFFCVGVTIAVFYNVIAPFRNYWTKPRFWCALAVLFAGHAAVLTYINGRVVRWSFWGFIALVGPEALTMILILGWVLGDNYFTRDTRLERAQAAAQKQRGEDTGDNTREPRG